MICIHGWQVGVGFVLSWLAGHFFGLAWNVDRHYKAGRRSLAYEIEEANGMHAPRCTCAFDPDHCFWHAGLWKRDDEKKESD